MDNTNYRNDLETRLVNKAIKDDQFRQNLINNTRDTVEKELGVSIPDSVSIKVIEENENEVCLVIPHAHISDEEISEVELEAVAGGWTGDHSWCDWCKYTECICGGP